MVQLSEAVTWGKASTRMGSTQRQEKNVVATPPMSGEPDGDRLPQLLPGRRRPAAAPQGPRSCSRIPFYEIAGASKSPCAARSMNLPALASSRLIQGEPYLSPR